jgi:hypothetical protein
LGLLITTTHKIINPFFDLDHAMAAVARRGLGIIIVYNREHRKNVSPEMKRVVTWLMPFPRLPFINFNNKLFIGTHKYNDF